MTNGRRAQHGPGSGAVGSTRRWSTVVGLAIGFIGAGFVIRVLISNWDQVRSAFTEARPLFLPLAFALGGVAMLNIGVAWHRSLRALGSSLPIASSLRGYFVGQLGKYIPGGIWAIMGRSEWARSEGVSGAAAYSSVLLSIGSAYLAAITLTAVLIPASAVVGGNGSDAYALLLLLLPLGFALIHPRVLRLMLTFIRRATSRELAVIVPSWKASSSIVVQQIPSWILIGMVSVTIAATLGSAGDVVNVISATTIAWVVGFIALPTPGGIGVREAVFVALATSLPNGIAATVALISRLLFIAVDSAGAGLTAMLVSRREAAR